MNSSNKCFFRSRFYLAAAIVFHLVQVYLICTGAQYYSEAGKTAVYAGFPSMLYVDHAVAALIALASVLQITALIRDIKKGGSITGLMRTAYIVLLIGQIGYVAGRGVITGLSPFTVSFILQVAAYLILCVLWFGCKKDSDCPGGENER